MINLYERISKEILKLVTIEDIDDKKLVVELEKRQEIIDSLTGNVLDDFKKYYKEKEIYKLDEEIKRNLEKHILSVKKEISEFKINKVGNSTYANMNKNNLNIFSKKV